MDPPAPTLQKSLYLWSVVGVVLLVQVGGDLTINIARNRIATQSSRYFNDNNNWKASITIDVNYQSCSNTKKETNPWWRVDLLKKYRVSSVNITNRGDETFSRINAAEIRIGNSLENHGTNNPKCDIISRIPAETTQNFSCYEMEGQYVSIHIPGIKTILSLCDMEVYGILNDSIKGNCSSTTSLPHDEYHFVDQKKTWTEAQSYCRQIYTDLATIDNTEDLNRLMETGNSGFEAAWIGLKKDKTQGKWQWSDLSNCSFRKWDVRQPYNLNMNQECVEIRMKKFWHDRNCDEIKPFFCHHDQVILIDENKTWWDAQTYCRQHHKDLVSVTSEKVQRWVEAKAKRASTPHVWLGLRYTCTLNIWFWVSGDPTCYHKWAPGNGISVEECGGTGVGRTGAIQRDGLQQWVGLNDTEQLNFICSI
ncbi:hypothetical protein UPYG_G00300950 [Umbra pygmaea]|uniref:C-type lectin domain-containing protein n=1 Tax=Umbra pygmaea TaxID=75934 RepID=A0ABD0WRE2_UMBPY